MSSSRLPGKSLADIGGEPSLALLLKRLRRARRLGRIVVATSTDAVDDPVAAVARSVGADVGRGPRDDVLRRFLLVLGDHDGPVVRITGDCPLIDPVVVDAVVERFESTPGCAYASNVEPRTFPDGLDVEVVASDALRAIANEDLSLVGREHVTVVVRGQPERFPAVAVMRKPDLGRLRWTVDEAEDLEFVRAVVKRLGERRYQAGIEEILTVVRAEPSLAEFGGAARG